MTDTRLFYCSGCNDYYPAERFEFYCDKNGVRQPRKQCRICNGALGHKVCATCRVDKQIEKFKAERKPSRNFTISYNKNCWACIYARRKEIGTVGYEKPPDRRRNKPEVAPRRLASGVRPPGWTPPPTAEQLAELHRRHSPPQNFQWPKGERCA